MRRHKKIIALAAAGVTVCAAATFFAVHYAIDAHGDVTGRVLAALTLVVALAALLAALAAVVLAWPAYDAWALQQTQKPIISISFQIGLPGKFELYPAPNGSHVELRSVSTADLTFPVRVSVRNTGDAALTSGMLNIMVPAPDCSIQPFDPEVKGHYGVRYPSTDGEIVPGQDTQVAFTVAQHDFPPGLPVLYHVRVTLPLGSEWPINAEIQGTELRHRDQRTRERIYVRLVGYAPEQEPESVPRVIVV